MSDPHLLFSLALIAQKKRFRSRHRKRLTHPSQTKEKNYSPSQQRGYDEETRALNYLEQQGLRCLNRNYRNVHDEIDLIMTDGQHIIFVEVRSRQHTHFGCALESIHFAKQKKLIRAANRYLSQSSSQKPCRFDVIAIDQGKIRWIVNAFTSDS